ncbi:MAG: flagella assembly protein FlgT middle domain-containing protein [Sulfuricella sp.]|jgi:hypothetical protein
MRLPAFAESFFARRILKTGMAALLAASLATAHVIAAENLAAAESAAASSAAPGDDTQPRTFWKTVAVTRFQVANSLQVDDIVNIWDGYPREFLRRLEAGGNIVARYSTASPYSDPRNINPDSPASRELIHRIAEQNGSQIVISGLILDAAVSDESLRPYFGWQGNETGRRFELGLPWNSVVAGVRPVATERRLEVEIFLHDGQTGALLKRHRNSVEISGRAAVGRDKAFASAAFFDTAFGQAVEQLLNTQTGLIGEDLAGLPFMANIVRIEDGKVFIDAGSLSALRPGDKLKVYHRNPAAPVESAATAALGIQESPVATLTLDQVHPLYAVGELADGAFKSRVRVGDTARAEATPRKKPR